MKKTAMLFLLAWQFGFCRAQTAPEADFPCCWTFSRATAERYTDAWTDSNRLPATSGGSGYISAVRGQDRAGRPFLRTVDSCKPSVATMAEGDCWLYTVPTERLEAGTALEFDATMTGKACSPKYFIVEYLDGGVWKSVAEDLLPVPEDPSLRYTYKCSGVASGRAYQRTNVMQTIRFDRPVEGAVQIRCRAVGPFTCKENVRPVTAENSACVLPSFEFMTARVQQLGTAIPRDTVRLLCLGNSFSYHANPVWMLKEIAWHEGHYLNIRGHFKGSQQLGHHLHLSFSTDAIDSGGYDYAFIQDQSLNPAKYDRDGADSIRINCTALADRIRAAAPSCKVILERTWAYPAGNCGGFADLAAFDGHLAAGARAMARDAGAWLSPIGEAFKAVRDAAPDIDLYSADGKHQSVYGAYLKACVNYLVLYGTAFGLAPADCGIEPSKAACLRRTAERVVLGHEHQYRIPRRTDNRRPSGGPGALPRKSDATNSRLNKM